MTPDIFVFADPQPKTHAEGDAAGFFDCAEAGGWLRQVPDGMVERMVPLLRGPLRPKGASLADVGVAHELAGRLLRAALGEG